VKLFRGMVTLDSAISGNKFENGLEKIDRPCNILGFREECNGDWLSYVQIFESYK
jgi:hypothetical protein